MSKRNINDLKRLIRSLSKNEKSYFKNDNSNLNPNTKPKKYLMLYDLISKKASNEKIESSGIYQNAKQYSRIRNYLYDTILTSLAAYHSETNTQISALSDLKKIEILFNKGLFASCLGSIAKTKKKLIRVERFAQLLDLLRLENQVIHYQSDFSQLQTLIKQSTQEAKQISEKHAIQLEYLQIYNQVFLIYKEFEGPFLQFNDKKLVNLNNLMSESLMRNEKQANSIRSHLIFCAIHMVNAQILCDAKLQLFYAKKLMHLFQSNPHFMLEEVGIYIDCYHGLMDALLFLRQYKEVDELILEFKQKLLLQNKYITEVLRSKIIYKSTILQLRRACEDPISIKNKRVFNKIITDADTHCLPQDTSNRIVLLYYQAYYAFQIKQYKNANQFLEEIFLINIKDKVKSVYLYARLMSALIHLELDNLDLFESRIRSLIRRYRSELTTHHPAIKFGVSLNNLSKRDFKDNDKLKALKADVINLIQVKRMVGHAWYFDMITWLDTKIKLGTKDVR